MPTPGGSWPAPLTSRPGLVGEPDVLVLALPRGGVPVGFEVARELGAQLDVLVVRKLGVPGHEELAMGAVALGGVHVVNETVVEALGVSADQLAAAAEAEQDSLDAAARAYRGERPPPEVSGRIVVLVDDGLATGSTMKAALGVVRRLGPARLIAAVPVAAREACRDMEAMADEAVCLLTPDPFNAVSLWYEDFSQTTDDEVRDLLSRADS